MNTSSQLPNATRRAPVIEVDGVRYIPASTVRETYGFSHTALWRVEKRPEFPTAVIFNGKRYYSEPAILEWARSQIAKSMSARVTAKAA